MGTISNPSCYHSALEYASKITGISKTKFISFEKHEDIRSKPHKFRNQSKKFKSKLIYQSDKIKVETECGKTVAYILDNNKRFDSVYKAKRFIIEISRELKEFGINFKYVSDYKDSLGGGWYSMVPMFKHNDFYYASMECAH